MLALHRSDVGDLNRRARSQPTAQRRSRRAGNRHRRPRARRGDRVIALRNRRRIGCSTALGHGRGRAGKDIVVETDEGARVQVPSSTCSTGHLTHAYAMTIHKSQGMTCDVALVLGDDTLHAEAGYTAMTRARTRNLPMPSTGREPGDALGGRPARAGATTAKTIAHDHLSVAR